MIHRLDINGFTTESKQFIAHHRESDNEIQTLWDHLLGTSQLCGQFADKLGLRSQGELIGFLHDLGKATDEFQKYLLTATGMLGSDDDESIHDYGQKGKVDHSTAGAQWLFRSWHDQGEVQNLAAQVLSLIMLSHHSGLIDCLKPDGTDGFFKRINKDVELTRLAETEHNLPLSVQTVLHEWLADPQTALELVNKMKDLKEADDSRETYLFKVGLLVRLLFSCLIDADRTDTARFERFHGKSNGSISVEPPWSLLIKRLETHLAGLSCDNNIDRHRNDISDKCRRAANNNRGIFQLTVPTGGGKTLASLRFALHHAHKHGMDRIIYVVPYTTIIDQNAQSVRDILEKEANPGSIVLEHHSNLTPEKQTAYQKILTENWDAPVIFTTMVQFLEALFGSGTRGVRRAHQMANAVIIFDEVQTLPIKCIHLFNVAIRFLDLGCGSTAVLCTATQPLLDQLEQTSKSLKIPGKNRIIQDVSALFADFKRVEVFNLIRPREWDENDVVDLIEKELNATGSVLIIVNTKKSAATLFKRIKKDFINSDAVLHHLSTNMCPAHRMEVLNEIRLNLDLNSPRRTICVSTQLIEAGVDIDFGSVIRYVAGLDSVAQAGGRCNRHNKRPQNGRVYIINPLNENIDRLEDIREGVKAAGRVLYENAQNPKDFDEDLFSEKAMCRYYKYYFFSRQGAMDYTIDKKSLVGRDDNLFELLSTNAISRQEYQRINKTRYASLIGQSFSSSAALFNVIDSNTRGIIVPFGRGEEIIQGLCSNRPISEHVNLISKAQRFSVNVYGDVFARLSDQHAIYETKPGSGIYYLNKQHYDLEYGITTSMSTDMDVIIA